MGHEAVQAATCRPCACTPCAFTHACDHTCKRSSACCMTSHQALCLCAPVQAAVTAAPQACLAVLSTALAGALVCALLPLAASRLGLGGPGSGADPELEGVPAQAVDKASNDKGAGVRSPAA